MIWIRWRGNIYRSSIDAGCCAVLVVAETAGSLVLCGDQHERDNVPDIFWNNARPEAVEVGSMVGPIATATEVDGEAGPWALRARRPAMHCGFDLDADEAHAEVARS